MLLYNYSTLLCTMLHYTTLHSVTLLHPEVPCVVDGMLKSGANGSLHNTTAEC